MSRRVWLRRAAATAVTLGLVWAAAALTRVPVLLHGDDEARVRLSWRMDGAVVRECRPATDEELARMPAHMVREEICEERIVPYRLTVRLDGREVLDREVRARGARADRPLSVFHEVPTTVGEHRVQVRFEPAAEGDPGLQDPPDLPRLELDTLLALGDRDVGLITYDRDRAMLRLRTPGPGRSPGTANSPNPPGGGTR